MWESFKSFLQQSWKAVIALAIPILWMGAIQLFEGLEGTFVDNEIALAVVTAVGVWLKANKPA
jgi:hypothetical protein